MCTRDVYTVQVHLQGVAKPTPQWRRGGKSSAQAVEEGKKIQEGIAKDEENFYNG